VHDGAGCQFSICALPRQSSRAGRDENNVLWYQQRMGSGGRRLTEDEEREVRQELAVLRQEHRDLDAAIAALADSRSPDTIRLQRLKKRKLGLKDRITVLEDRLLPDIIA
jgi:hypothetical protein